MIKYKFLTIFLLLFVVSCSPETKTKPGVTKQDITRMCSKLASTPQYMAERTFTDEYYKLEDKAGRSDSHSSSILKLKLAAIKLGAFSTTFQSSCEEELTEEFL